MHCIALRDARTLPPSHLISHILSTVALCRRWQRWSTDNIHLKVSKMLYHFALLGAVFRACGILGFGLDAGDG